jgi:SpoVK/Ycf46/Vps4 family AAA+-type ATPase
MADVSAAQSNKYHLLNRGGVLSYEPDTGGFALVGGLKRLREWLARRRPAFEAAAKLDAPKGLLLIGVQGCGKSLAAKAAAGLLGVSLLRLDVGTIFSKWHGESEKNLRDALAAAESLAPCVLWIDEIEKAFASGENDGGTTRRVLGGFLTWLSEKRARVFVVATANEIAALPPELVRKGRFDEIFFVDLPDAGARAEILQIHARRRGIPLDAAAAAALAARAAGFSGAELEQAVVSAAYHVHDASAPPDARAIAREIANTQPLSVVMAEKIGALRAWAAERTVPAD